MNKADVYRCRTVGHENLVDGKWSCRVFGRKGMRAFGHGVSGRGEVMRTNGHEYTLTRNIYSILSI